MKRFITHLPKLILSVLLAPILHIAALVMYQAMNQQAPEISFYRFLFFTQTLSYVPYRIIKGRFPSIYEFQQFSPLEYILKGLFVVLIWFIVSVLLLHLLLRILRRWQSAKWVLVAGLFIMFGGVIAFRLTYAQQSLPTTPTITVDLTQLLGEFPTHQRGFSQGGEGQMPQIGYFEQIIEPLQAIHPRLIRIDHVYDYYGVLSYDNAGKPVYDWTQLDRIIDIVFETGAKPLMSLSYTPPVLADKSVYAPPTDLDAWEELVYQTVYHYNIKRDLDIDYWEVWNEPNLPGFWTGTIEEYVELYAASARGIKRADPTALIGGLATSSPNTIEPSIFLFVEKNWIDALLAHIKQNDLPFDFFSWHYYTQSPEAYTENIRLHQEWISDLTPQPQLLMTEWNYNAGSSEKMDNGETAAFLAESIARFTDSDLTQAFYFEPIDGRESWEGSWGLIRADGLGKASYYTFQLLDKLQGQRLLVESDHPYVGALASKSEDGVHILVWNRTTGISINLTIQGHNEDDDVLVSIEGVDKEYGNPYYDKSVTNTFIEQSSQAIENNQLILQLEIPSQAIRLIRLDFSQS